MDAVVDAGVEGDDAVLVVGVALVVIVCVFVVVAVVVDAVLVCVRAGFAVVVARSPCFCWSPSERWSQLSLTALAWLLTTSRRRRSWAGRCR